MMDLTTEEFQISYNKNNKNVRMLEKICKNFDGIFDSKGFCILNIGYAIINQ